MGLAKRVVSVESGLRAACCSTNFFRSERWQRASFSQ